MAVIATEHHRAQLCHNGSGPCNASNDFFRYNTPVVDWQVGKMQCRAHTANRVSDGIEHLLLCQRLVIGDVVDASRRVLMVSCQQETLYNVCDVTKWQRIIPASNNQALAILHL